MGCGLGLGLVWCYSQGMFVVRVGIRVMLALWLQLVSSRFGIIVCRLLYVPLCYVGPTCDIFSSEINTLLLLLLWLELDG